MGQARWFGPSEPWSWRWRYSVDFLAKPYICAGCISGHCFHRLCLFRREPSVHGHRCVRRVLANCSQCFSLLGSELVHQMKTVAPKVFLVHPSLLEVGLKAAAQCGIPASRVYLYSDTEVSPQAGLQDWRRFMAPEKDSANWHWPSFSVTDARKTVATINFSSVSSSIDVTRYNH